VERLLNAPLDAEPVNELTQLREDLESLREDFAKLQSSLERDRQSIGKMLHSLRAIFSGNGEMPSGPVSPLQPPNDAAWEMWKRRLPGACPQVIDALLIQPLTATQLISATGTSYSTVQRALNVLKGNGLTEKDGTRIRLKRL
jgi:DNA-binding transcriptional ArsR family regulator